MIRFFYFFPSQTERLILKSNVVLGSESHTMTLPQKAPAIRRVVAVVPNSAASRYFYHELSPG
jgi:hypothetical protein